MSTENTQTDLTQSDVSAESTNVNTGSTDTPVSAAVETRPSLDGLKKMAKDSASPDFKPAPVSDALSAKAAAPVIPATPYAPNFKYKAALQEKEVDEFWRPLMKDKESEKKVIEALQKIDGLDFVKQSREELSKQYESLNNDYQEQQKVVDRVRAAVSRKDLSSVFRQLDITEQDIFKWTHQQLQIMDLPPEQRRAMEEAENARIQKYDLEEQMSQFQSMYEAQAVQARTMQLDFALSKPDAVSAAEKWDNVTGEPGAFRNLVIQEAQTAFYQEKVDLSAEQAVQRVMQKYGKVISANAQGSAIAPQAQNPMAQPPVQATIPQAKPVIPNINGKGTAPIKKVPKSLDDLKKMARELNA